MLGQSGQLESGPCTSIVLNLYMFSNIIDTWTRCTIWFSGSCSILFSCSIPEGDLTCFDYSTFLGLKDFIELGATVL